MLTNGRSADMIASGSPPYALVASLCDINNYWTSGVQLLAWKTDVF
jgi:hypothetical protein